MELIGEKVKLKTFNDDDAKEYFDWYTNNVEWQKWDAPWIKRDFNIENIIKKKKEGNSMNPIMTFEIYTISNKHIGWVNAYFMDNQYIPTAKKTEKIAIGLDIPDKTYREQGNGTEALRLFINYLKEKEIKKIYIQTWSGNHRMIRVAEKLGFVEINRYKDKRVVNKKKYDALTFIKSI